MKLKHRGTGNWGEPLSTSGHNIIVREYACHFGEKPYVDHHYDSLEKLNTEWEDYEEPKKHYWVIDDDGVLICRTVGDFTNEEMCKQIGNYFETEKEAEKAVKKLKAWKRLRDKGFRFGGRYKPNYGEKFIIECSLPKETLVIGVAEDLDLLFGGEE